MSEPSRRKSSSPKTATKKRLDQRSDPKKLKYKIRRKIPAPSLDKPEGNGKLNDEQLAMPFVVPKRIEAQPFLKWVGGKAGLLRQLEEFFPHEIDRYFEPFLGGGAVFFHLKHRFPDMRPFLRDGNKELINCFRAVRDRPEDLMQLLDEHSHGFRADGDTYFYDIRKQHDLTDDLARAARTIFLNKTCFNGLWRVNAKGEFNTPVGSNKNPNLYSRDNLLAASDVLQNAQLEAQDFRKTVDEARRGDFIYFDPPYLPISAYSDFKRYTLEQFREADQVELARVFRELDAKGCRVVLSNSEHPRTRELYAGFPIQVVSAPRFINCKPGGRGNISELVVSNTSAAKQPQVFFTSSAEPEFPETKYMGSKQRLLPFILKHLAKIKFNSALDAFSGSGCVGYAIKQTGARVYANDFLNFCFQTARATIENNSTKLTEEDVSRLVRPNASAPTFVRDTYKDLFFIETDCEFLDNLWANIQELESPLKISLALAAASRACMKKRPRGLFTFTGIKGWDGRKDLKLSMCEQFLIAVNALNSAVFSNGQQNKAFNSDVFDLQPDLADLVYIDTPYISPFSDCDYTRRYHFVEGYCRYWKGVEITDTTTKKMRSYDTVFSTKARARQAFQKLFHHFRKSTLAISYSSNCIPSKAEMIELLKNEKSKVTVYESAHRYHHGNHAHKVGDNRNEVIEYLFIAE
jgi:DNA adenine methylase